MIDLCIAIQGPNLDVLLPLCIGSMTKSCDLSQFNIHIVSRGCSEPINLFIKDLLDKKIIHSSRLLENKFNRSFGQKINYLDNWVHDTSGSCQWMADNCGSEDWVFICHFDLVFIGDILAKYSSMINAGVGQVGEHKTGLVGYSRAAIKHCGARFDNLDGLRVAKDDRGHWRLRYSGDRRCTGEVINITGLDVAEWLELSIALNGWDVCTFTDSDIEKMMIHYRCGSAYHGDSTINITRSVAEQELYKFGFEKITL